LALVAGYIPRWYARPKMVTHPSTQCSRKRVQQLKPTDSAAAGDRTHSV